MTEPTTAATPFRVTIFYPKRKPKPWKVDAKRYPGGPYPTRPNR